MDANTTNPVNDNTEWTMEATAATQDGPCSGYKTQLTFILAYDESGSTIPDYGSSGGAALPRIVWHGTTSNLAAGTATSTIGLDAGFAKTGQIAAGHATATATATAAYTVSDEAGSSGIISADQDKAEIDDAIGYTWSTYVKDTNMSGTMRTVIKLPDNTDVGMTGKDDTGLDGTWSEYDRGSSQYSGTYTLADEPTVDADDSTATTLTYATETKDSLTPDDYTWKTWDEIDDKSLIRAILVTSDLQETQSDGDDRMMVAASTGTITITPSGNTEHDQYNMWLGANHVERSAGTEEHIPWPAVTRVVMGSIAGTIWWDQDQNTLIGKDEERIEGIQVSLYRTDEDGNPTGDAVATAHTDADGTYRFDRLHSDDYLTEVKCSQGDTTDDGVQTTTTTYYGDERDVANTRSWSNQLKDQAKDTSDRIRLTIGQDLTHVDFGYAKPDPKATVDKTRTSLECDDATCTVNWDVTVENTGNTSFDASGALSDRTSSNVRDVTATAGTVNIETGGAAQVATSGEHKFALTDEGVLYAWGNNRYGQLGFAPDTTSNATVSNTAKPTIVAGTWSRIAAGGKHSAAISIDGHLYVAGWNGSGQLGLGDTDNRSEWTETAGDKTFTDVACGDDSTIAIASDGTLWYAGWDSSGTTGWTLLTDGTFTQVSAHGRNWAAVAADGTVRYGMNIETYAYRGNTGVTDVSTLEGSYTQVAAGGTNILALTTDGTVASIDGGSLHGEGNTGTLTGVTGITAGTSTGYAITADGHLWSWGWNGDGQLANGQAGDGTGWTAGTANTTSDVVEPADTGITASAVAAGDRDALIISDTVLVAGYDPYGDGLTGTARTTGLKGITATSDPDATPVTAVSETDDGEDTTRVWQLPYALEKGGRVVFHLTGTIDRTDADQTIHNQAWFDSTDTPYQGTPNARAAGASTPDKPTDTNLDTSSNDITGNPSCRTGSDYQSAAKEHTFTDGHEDSCDQVGDTIPAATEETTTGTISGLIWKDANRDGVRQDDETDRIGGQRVVLYDTTGRQVASTTTSKDGSYEFTGLKLDTAYTVQFALVDDTEFTSPDQGDASPTDDRSGTDSDASDGEDDYGRATATIILTETNPDKTHIDAGVKPWMRSMPTTGMGILPVILIIGIALTAIGLGMYARDTRNRKKKEDKQ